MELSETSLSISGAYLYFYEYNHKYNHVAPSPIAPYILGMMKPCPICALHVKPDTVKCPHCGNYVSKRLRGFAPPGATTTLYHPSLPRRGPRAYGLSRRAGMIRGMGALLLIGIAVVLISKSGDRDPFKAGRFISVTPEAFERTFGPKSELTPDEKSLEFEGYKMKHVRWEGTIVYINASRDPEAHISLHHGTSSLPFSPDVTLYPHPQENERLSELRVGDHLSYSGVLVNYGNNGMPVVIQGGRILDLN